MDLVNIIIGIYILNFITMIVLVCFERRDPVVSLAWLFGFVAVPVVGYFVFLVFGTGLKRKTAKKYAEKWYMNMDLTEKITIEEERKKLKEYKFLPYSDIMTYLLNINNSVLTDGNDVKIYTDAQSKFDELFKDIKEAKDSIHLIYFIIRNDEVGNKLIDLLTSKAREGVKVRLLYDDIGCFTTKRELFNKLKEAGGEVNPFFPVRFGTYFKLNHRNHRKIVVIDGKIGYTGGINVGDEYFGKNKLSPWRDTHIKIVGPAVRYLQKAFSLDWTFSTGEDLSLNIARYFPTNDKLSANKRIQVVCSGPDTEADEIESALIKMINSAKDHVYITTPYFVPDQSFLNAVKLAAESGVDVRIIIPGLPDKKYVYYSSLSYVGELMASGVRVYKYNGFIHAKTLSVDEGICTIGTTNIDMRSFKLHFEINAFIYDGVTTEECNKIFREDLKNSVEITPAVYSRRSIINRVIEGFCRLFSPIM